jgi:hypothetical protein
LADLKDEEIKRLASDFLTAKAGEAEVAALHTALENNAAAALEFLAQVQAAREGAGRAGLTAEQNESVRQRVEALIASRARKRGFFGLFRGRPKPIPAPEPVPAPASAPVPVPIAVPAAAPLPGSAAVPAAAPLPAPVAASAPLAPPAAAPLSRSPAPVGAAEAAAEADMEDTAPIAELTDPASVLPRMGAPGSALAAMQAAPPAPSASVASSASPPEPPLVATPAPEKPAVQKPLIVPAAINFGVLPETPPSYAPKAAPKSRKGMAAVLILLVLLALGYYYRGTLLSLYAPPAPPVVHHVRLPPPPMAPSVQGPAVRADAAAPVLDAPLPAQLPPSTPATSGD